MHHGCTQSKTLRIRWLFVAAGCCFDANPNVAQDLALALNVALAFALSLEQLVLFVLLLILLLVLVPLLLLLLQSMLTLMPLHLL